MRVFFQLRFSFKCGHPYKLYKHFTDFSNKAVRQGLPVNLWKSLPVDTVNFSCLSTFKKSLMTVALLLLAR